MPIYMDRHYIEGATQHAVKTAHFKDLKLQDEFGVSFLTYWFDEERSTAFCLVDAPDAESVGHVHRKAHGLVPNEIIPVDPAVVEAFLGRVADPVSDDKPSAEKNPDSAFRAIMFTDLKDSTAMGVQLGDKKAMHFLRIHNAITRNAIREYEGREVKHTGDGFLISFDKITNALAGGIAVQRSLRAYNNENPCEMIHVRIGLSAGEPVDEDGDLYGTSVNLAARLCTHAEPDGILVDSTVHELCGDPQFAFVERDAIVPKGFAETVQVYEVLWQ